jgi:hypothetical protein
MCPLLRRRTRSWYAEPHVLLWSDLLTLRAAKGSLYGPLQLTDWVGPVNVTLIDTAYLRVAAVGSQFLSLLLALFLCLSSPRDLLLFGVF